MPDDAQESEWDSAVAGAASDPVVATTAGMSYDAAGAMVTQTLTAVRASGRPGVWALLPHQRDGLADAPGTHTIAGRYANVRGGLSLVVATTVRVRIPLPGLLPGVPAIALAAPARAAVVADLERDLADPDPGGGSYFGFKELARLASIAEVAGATGATTQRQAARPGYARSWSTGSPTAANPTATTSPTTRSGAG